MKCDFEEQLRAQFAIEVKSVSGSRFRTLCHAWLQAFCPAVKRQTGQHVYGGIRWHAYSFQFQAAVCGQIATDQYLSMPLQPFFLFHEPQDRLFECEATQLPDLRVFNTDLYLFPRTLEWSYITTHEMSLGLGPYFAHRSEEI